VSDPSDLHGLLLRHFGFSEFRTGQEQIIRAVLAGEDTVAILPTGGGKSLCYQLPALAREGVTLVVSPLIALMKDQVDGLVAKNLPATFINSTLSPEEQRNRIDRMVQGEYKIVYVAPERFRNINFSNSIIPGLVTLFAIDEAHCHPAGTLISMADGSQKPIERVILGDFVLSFNGEKVTQHRVEESRIKRVGHRKMLKIITPKGGVLLTDDHPVFLNGKGYDPARDVNPSDTVLCVEGFTPQELRVDRVETIEPDDHERDKNSGYDHRVVYALTVAEDHAYFANGILTHNCISSWGHDFRPDYLKLRDAIRDVGNPPVMALTATATPMVRRDIIKHLGLGCDGRKPPKVFISGFARPNLMLSAEGACGLYSKLPIVQGIIAQHKTGIVYCSTRKTVDSVSKHIKGFGIRAVAYHAGLTDKARLLAQNQFMQGEADVAVATNAFGMGIDRADLRFVTHFAIPGSVESYYQEAGRAGRDGKPAVCKLLYDPRDVETQQFFIEGSNPSEQVIRSVMNTLRNLCSEDPIEMSIQDIAKNVASRMNPMAVGTSLILLERAGWLRRSHSGGKRVYTTTVPFPDRELDDLDIDFGRLSAKRKHDFERLNHVILYARSSKCRHGGILVYFGEAETMGSCTACDNCESLAKQFPSFKEERHD